MLRLMYCVVFALSLCAHAVADSDPKYVLSFASFAPLNADIFIAEADGREARPLFAHPAQDIDAVFAPDGTWLVFASNREGSFDLYRAKVDGSDLERIVDHAAYDDQPSISPDGRVIAFVSSRTGNADIWVMDLATRNSRNLTQHAAGDFRPAWSPDGQWIAFSSDRVSKRPIGPGGFAIVQSTEIFVMRADGTDVRQVTHDDVVTGSPTWSPDGKKLVFYRATLAAAGNIASPRLLRDTMDIVEVELSSGKQRVLTASQGEKRSPAWIDSQRLAYVSDGPEGGIEFASSGSGARGQFKNPSWSRDGKRMLFHRDVDARWPPHQRLHSLDSRFDLVRVGVFSAWSPQGDRLISNDRTAGILHNSVISMKPDGSDRRVVFTDEQKSALAPVWSHQGDRIAFGLGSFFQAIKGVAISDIVSTRPDGTDARTLTGGDSNFGFPSWSADGRSIVFREASAQRNALHVVDVETKARRVLLTGSAHYNFPGWSPKGDRIAFTSNMHGDYEIYTIRPDGSDLKRLTHSPGVDGHSAWSPDGEWLAFSSGRSGFKDEFLLYQANPQAYGDIYVMRADGSEQHALTDDQFEEATPGWTVKRQ